MERRALDYLQRDPIHHMDIIQPILRGSADILAAEDHGVLIRERKSRGHFLAADAPETASHLMDLIDTAQLMSVHDEASWYEAERRFSLARTMVCHQAVWTKDRSPAAPDPAYAFRPLPLQCAPEIVALYSHAIDPAYIEGRLRDGELFGLFSGDDMAGFIGLHEEGSMGMLEVKPAHRRMGIATQLLTHLIDQLLAKGFTPFSQFTIANEPSRRLHERLGFSITQKRVYWLEPNAHP